MRRVDFFEGSAAGYLIFNPNGPKRDIRLAQLFEIQRMPAPGR
jgi:hypothetical protein